LQTVPRFTMELNLYSEYTCGASQYQNEWLISTMENTVKRTHLRCQVSHSPTCAYL
jgi:hypothetical protein